MAENEERKPFMSFSFTEEGVFDRYAGIYLHVPLERPPSGEEIAIMVGRIKTFAECWKKITKELGMAEAQPQEYDEPPPDEQGTAPTEAPREAPSRPRGGATEPQCKKILAVCHRLGDDTVIEAIKGYAGAEWRLDKDGHCLPDWGFLQSLDKFQASKVIERLERAEA